MGALRVATCQFPVGPSVDQNLDHVQRQMRQAREQGARVVHFGEGALSGYAGVDLDTFEGYDWRRLIESTTAVAETAAKLGIWVIIGSAHPLTPPHRPHNSVYVIDDQGQPVERYDKRFCSGDVSGTEGDLAHYSPGNHLSVWSIDGVTCGVLICFDYRYPELYRAYKQLGVEVLFHSFHTGRMRRDQLAAISDAIGLEHRRWNIAPTYTYPGITMPAAATAAAACNYMWISCANSSAPESAWPAFFVRSDGITLGRLDRNVAGVADFRC